MIATARAGIKFCWWAYANLNLPFKPIMNDARALAALKFENIGSVDDQEHWADILAEKVIVKLNFRMETCTIFELLQFYVRPFVWKFILLTALREDKQHLILGLCQILCSKEASHFYICKCQNEQFSNLFLYQVAERTIYNYVILAHPRSVSQSISNQIEHVPNQLCLVWAPRYQGTDGGRGGVSRTLCRISLQKAFLGVKWTCCPSSM